MTSPLKHALANIKSNFGAVASAIAIVALLFTVVNILVYASLVAQRIVTTIQGKISFNVYLASGADFFTIRKMMDALEERGDVVPPVVFLSPEEAKKELAGSLGGDENFLDRYAVELPGVLTVTPRAARDRETIAAFLEESEFREILTGQNRAEGARESQTLETVSRNVARLQGLISSLVRLVIAVTAAAGLATVLLTLRFTAALRTRELFIMKLVGARAAMLELPYILEGIFIAVFGFVFGAAAFLWLTPRFVEDSLLREVFEAMPFASLFLAELLIAIAIGGVGSGLMIRTVFFSRNAARNTLR